MTSPEALARLHAACFTMPRPWTAAEFTALLADPLLFCLGTDHGIALGRVVLDEAELLTLAVEPDRRRQGAGTALLRQFEAEAALRGAARAFLEVAASNTAAIALYRAAGYVQSGLRKGYFRAADGKTVDALILSRPLDAAAPVKDPPGF